MRPVFTDPQLQATFDELGYAPIKGFLSKAEVEELKQAYFDTLPERGGSMLSEETDLDTDAAITYDFTFIDRNWEYKQLVFDLITEKFSRIYPQYLDNYKPIIANYIRKEKDAGEVPLHQNWAFVDERKYTSVSIWVPLVDSNEENGTLQFVDGSHKRYGEFRGPLVPWELEGIKENIIADHLTPAIAEAGDCVVLDDSVVHYSAINKTGGLRLTIQLIMIPEEATAIHYHLPPEGDRKTITVYEVDRDFFMKFHPWLKPEAKVIGTRSFEASSLSVEDFQAKLGAPPFDQEPAKAGGFLQRLKRMFA